MCSGWDGLDSKYYCCITANISSNVNQGKLVCRGKQLYPAPEQQLLNNNCWEVLARWWIPGMFEWGFLLMTDQETDPNSGVINCFVTRLVVSGNCRCYHQHHHQYQCGHPPRNQKILQSHLSCHFWWSRDIFNMQCSSCHGSKIFLIEFYSSYGRFSDQTKCL